MPAGHSIWGLAKSSRQIKAAGGNLPSCCRPSRGACRQSWRLHRSRCTYLGKIRTVTQGRYLLELNVGLALFLGSLGGGCPVFTFVEVTHARDLQNVVKVGVMLYVLGLLQELDGLRGEHAWLIGLEGSAAVWGALVASVAG